MQIVRMTLKCFGAIGAAAAAAVASAAHRFDVQPHPLMPGAQRPPINRLAGADVFCVHRVAAAVTAWKLYFQFQF